MQMNSPFGKYAALVAAFAAVVILAGWMVSSLHIAGAESSDALNAVALVVIGAIFGTGVGASVVSNGVGTKVDAANARLDGIGAPSAAAVASAPSPIPDPATMTDPGA